MNVRSENCPHCGSRDIAYETEHDEEGNETAAYYVCNECGAGWTYQQSKEPQ